MRLGAKRSSISNSITPPISSTFAGQLPLDLHTGDARDLSLFAAHPSSDLHYPFGRDLRSARAISAAVSNMTSPARATAGSNPIELPPARAVSHE